MNQCVNRVGNCLENSQLVSGHYVSCLLRIYSGATSFFLSVFFIYIYMYVYESGPLMLTISCSLYVKEANFEESWNLFFSTEA